MANTSPTFVPVTGSGIVTTPGFNGRVSSAEQPDGKIVVGVTQSGNFEVLRYNADGSRDTHFGGAQGAVADISGAGSDDQIQTLTVLPDGKVVAVGYSTANGVQSFAVVRYNADGALDTGFGDGDGIVTTQISGGSSLARGVAVQADGKLLVTGRYNADLNSAFESGFVTVRYNADGSLDTNFHNGGNVITPAVALLGDTHGIGANGGGTNVIALANGGFMVCGSVEGGGLSTAAVLARYTAAGDLDTSFNLTGALVTPIRLMIDQAGEAMTVLPDGHVVVTGYVQTNSGFQFAAMRYNADGSPDLTFNGTGSTFLGAGAMWGTGVVVQPDGKVVAAGFGVTGVPEVFVVRYTETGVLDTAFGTGGRVDLNIASNSGFMPYSVLIQADGKLLISGSGNGVSLVRLNPDGSLDTSFDNQGGTGDTLGGTVSYTEHSAPIALDSSVAVLDADLAALASGAGDYAGSSVTLARVGGANAQDQFSAVSGSHLSFTAGNAVLSGVTVGTVTNASGSLAITFNHSATQAVVNEVLSAIAYANSSSGPSSTVQIGWTFDDGNTGSQGSGGALAGTGVTTVNVIYAAAATPITPNHSPWGMIGLDGAAGVNNTLTANTSGLVDPDGIGANAFHYQWLSDGHAIAGATSASYTVANGDSGHGISVQVTYTDLGNHAESATSYAMAAYGGTPAASGGAGGGGSPAAPAANQSPWGGISLSGSAAVNATLSAVTSGLVDPDGIGANAFSYQWLNDGHTITGATSASYTVANGDSGHGISVQVSYTDLGGHSEVVSSSAYTAYGGIPAASGGAGSGGGGGSGSPAPAANQSPWGGISLSGSSDVLGTLHAVTSNLVDPDGIAANAFHYQWFRDTTAITNATNESYQVQSTDATHGLSVQVSYTDNAGHLEVVGSYALLAYNSLGTP